MSTFLKLNKDIVNFIANLCSPITITRLSSTSKQLYLILSKHPILNFWKYSLEHKTLIYCLQKAGSARFCDLIDLLLTKNPKIYSHSPLDVLQAASEAGHVDLVMSLLNSKGANIFGAIKYAAIGGHRHLVRLLIQKLESEEEDYSGCEEEDYSGCWDMPLQGAARGGHKDLVSIFLEKGASKYNCFAFESACLGGHLELVNFFLHEQGKITSNIYYAIGGAAEGGHLNLVISLFSNFHYRNDEKVLNYFLAAASEGGQRHVVDYFIEQGANDWNWGLRMAAFGGHHNLIDLFFEKGADPYLGISDAERGGHNDTQSYLENLCLRKKEK